MENTKKLILLFVFLIYVVTPQILKGESSIHAQIFELERNGNFLVKIHIPNN